MNEPEIPSRLLAEGSRWWNEVRELTHAKYFLVILAGCMMTVGLAIVNRWLLHSVEASFLAAFLSVVFVFGVSFAVLLGAMDRVAARFDPDSHVVPRTALVTAVALTAAYSVLFIPSLLREGVPQSGPLVMTGSSNVRSRLLDLKAPYVDTKQEAPWLDIGSGAALRVVFQAFDYGHRTGTDTERFGLVALSSAGVEALARMYINPTGEQPPQAQRSQSPQNQKPEDELPDSFARRKDNYWLDIELPPVPLVLLFNGKLKTYPAASLPEDSAGKTTPSYRLVPFSSLKDFFECNFRATKEKRCQNNERATLYVPEADSGTRALINKAGTISWPPNLDSFRHYEEYIEGFPQKEAFAELVTWAPLSRERQRPATCSDFNGRVHVAAVSALRDGKPSLMWTRFSVVMKVSHHTTQAPEYEITNSAECELAKSLADADIDNRGGKCIVKNTQEYHYHSDSDNKNHVIDHIRTLLLPPMPGNPLPRYLTCPNQE